MTFGKGALILVDFTAKVKDSGEVFDTTVKEEAIKHSIYDPDVLYTPKLVSVGESWVLRGLDEELANSSVGDKRSVEIPPDKAFGVRDPKKIRVVSERKLEDEPERLSIGDWVTVDDRSGVIKYMGSGRLKIDFNHRYAGRTIVYDINVIRSLDSDDDKIRPIIDRHFRMDDNPPPFENGPDCLDIMIPEEVFGAEWLQSTKRFTQQDLFKFIPSLPKVRFVETHENKLWKARGGAGDPATAVKPGYPAGGDEAGGDEAGGAGDPDAAAAAGAGYPAGGDESGGAGGPDGGEKDGDGRDGS